MEKLEASLKAVKPIKFNVDPKNERVEQFRRDLDGQFVRYQTFYDRSNAAMRNYRFAHVDLVTMVYNRMMTVFGEDINAIVELNNEFLELIANRTEEVGENNTCLQGVVDLHDALHVRVGSDIQACAIFANTTMEGMLRNVFYPTFAEIQNTISTTPNAVIDALSRGNVLEDEEEILEFLRARFEVLELQWLSAVSQLLRWESNRFEVDALFLVDEMTLCVARPVVDYIITVATLQTQARACN